MYTYEYHMAIYIYVRGIMNTTVREIAALVNGRVEGDIDLPLYSLSSVESNVTNSLTFLAHAKYYRHLYNATARGVLVPEDFELQGDTKATLIRVNNVYAAYADISHWAAEQADKWPKEVVRRIATSARIDGDTIVHDKVSVGEYTIIGPGAQLHEAAVIGDLVSIGSNVTIGARTIIMTGVRIMDGVIIGCDCIIYPNAVIGAEGFGYALGGAEYKKIHHSASVIIEDHVEIGSCTVIDRGALTDTIIRRGAKLDNLIQVAHGVEIGEDVVIAAQSGIAGSAKIGKGSQLGGQVGVAGHLTIAEGSQIQAQSGVSSSISEPHKKWYGYPILPYYNYLRSYSVFKNLSKTKKED